MDFLFIIIAIIVFVVRQANKQNGTSIFGEKTKNASRNYMNNQAKKFSSTSTTVYRNDVSSIDNELEKIEDEIYDAFKNRENSDKRDEQIRSYEEHEQDDNMVFEEDPKLDDKPVFEEQKSYEEPETFIESTMYETVEEVDDSNNYETEIKENEPLIEGLEATKLYNGKYNLNAMTIDQIQIILKVDYDFALTIAESRDTRGQYISMYDLSLRHGLDSDKINELKEIVDCERI